MSVTVPEGYSVDHVPADFAVSNPCLTLRRYSVVRSGTVTVVVDTRYTCDEIAVADYAAFRDSARTISIGSILQYRSANREPQSADRV